MALGGIIFLSVKLQNWLEDEIRKNETRASIQGEVLILGEMSLFILLLTDTIIQLNLVNSCSQCFMQCPQVVREGII